MHDRLRGAGEPPSVRRCPKILALHREFFSRSSGDADAIMKIESLLVVFVILSCVCELGCVRDAAPPPAIGSFGQPLLNFRTPDSLVYSVWTRNAWADSIKHVVSRATDYYSPRAESMMTNHWHLMRLVDSSLYSYEATPRRDTIWRRDTLPSGRLRLTTHEQRGDRAYYMVMLGGRWRVDEIFVLCPFCEGRGQIRRRPCVPCGGYGAFSDFLNTAHELPTR
jgi:hypothetical protein